MSGILAQQDLHRTAKYFMDNGRVESHTAAIDLLCTFGLTVYVGEEITGSADHQTALLTLVNVARRTLLGGVDVVGLPDVQTLTPLGSDPSLRPSVESLGASLVESPRPGIPAAVIGTACPNLSSAPSWRLTWEGWRGGVVPAESSKPLSDRTTIPLAPALAAAVCAAEVFMYFANDHLMAGKRSLGLSLWCPGADWLEPDESEPSLVYLPSRLWLIGLGNLGQAYAWLLASLPYENQGEVQLVLQDFDRIAKSNNSTSVLSVCSDVGRKKTRVVSDWLEARGFETCLVERRFGLWTHRAEGEPSAALCGVDNENARMALEQAGFRLVVESGLGAGPQAFRSIAMHTFPASRTPAVIWSHRVAPNTDGVESMPAYQALKRDGLDKCGITQLASRTVGVPFVGVTAACLVISEILRRLHGGQAIEVLSTSLASLGDVEHVGTQSTTYDCGFVKACRAHLVGMP